MASTLTVILVFFAPAGTGLRESALVFFLAPQFLSAADAAAASILFRLLLLGVEFAAGAFALFFLGGIRMLRANERFQS